jgi:hypothetical protein
MTEFPKEISAADFYDFKTLFANFIVAIKDEYKNLRDGIREDIKASRESRLKKIIRLFEIV